MKRQPDLVTTIELAEHLRVTPETIHAWTRRGVIPSLRPSRKIVRYSLSAVLEAIEAARNYKANAKATTEHGGTR